MSDGFSEVTYQSPFSRIAESFKGVIVGLVFCVLAPVGLWFNEKNAVDTAAALTEGAGKVVSVPAATKDASGTAKLVHVTGKAETKATLKDPDFGVSVNALKLEREVEMYQWEEEKKSKSTDTISGSKKTETHYEYNKVWDTDEIDSEKFHEKGRDKHRNPKMTLKSIEQVADDVKLGEFKVNTSLVKMISKDQPLPITAEMIKTFPQELQDKYKAANGQLQTGDPAKPEIGDLRVTFKVTNQQDISVVASSMNNDFTEWKASNGKSIWLLECGIVDAPAMFQNAQDMNVYLTWFFRFLGFVVMWIGISLVVSPISTIARSIPLFGMLMGGAVGAGVGFFAFVVAAFVSTVVIAIAWFAARPMLSIGLMVAVLALIFAARSMRKGSQPAKG